MAEVVALRREAITEQLATYGGAFGTGVILGWVASTRPTWGTAMTMVAGAGGAIGALMTRGMTSQMLQGVGAAAMGALGASLPALFGGAARRVGTATSPKLLGPATNIVAESIARQVKSAVEF